jgi:hypothetical protein
LLRTFAQCVLLMTPLQRFPKTLHCRFPRLFSVTMTNKGCAIRRSAGTDGGALAVTMVSIQLPREVMANRMTNQRAHSGFYVY